MTSRGERIYDRDTDKDYLEAVYSSGRNLDAKYEVMRRFALHAQQFEDYVIERLGLTGRERILDIGCGQGRFLLPIARSAKSKGGLTVGCDISLGVMKELRRAVATEQLNVLLLTAEAEALPFVDESFDLAMANHMLYHIEDIDHAVREAWRVLPPGGRFLATTNSRRGMPEMHGLHMETMNKLGIPYDPEIEHRFELENGRGYLESVFGNVEVLEFDGGFRAPTPDPVLMYYKATQLFQAALRNEDLTAEQRNAIEPTYRRLAERMIEDRGGEMVVSKLMGAFISLKPATPGVPS